MRSRALEAWLFAVCGTQIYYYFLRFDLGGPLVFGWVRDVAVFNSHLIIRTLSPRLIDTLWFPWIFLEQMLLPGAILGIGAWLIYRLTLYFSSLCAMGPAPS